LRVGLTAFKDVHAFRRLKSLGKLDIDTHNCCQRKIIAPQHKRAALKNPELEKSYFGLQKRLKNGIVAIKIMIVYLV